MTTDQLQLELRRRGVSLSLGEGGLVVDAPRGALDDVIVQQIRQHKPCLVMRLEYAAMARRLDRAPNLRQLLVWVASRLGWPAVGGVDPNEQAWTVAACQDEPTVVGLLIGLDGGEFA